MGLRNYVRVTGIIPFFILGISRIGQFRGGIINRAISPVITSY